MVRGQNIVAIISTCHIRVAGVKVQVLPGKLGRNPLMRLIQLISLTQRNQENTKNDTNQEVMELHDQKVTCNV